MRDYQEEGMMKRVTLKLTQPIKLEWSCPECKATNIEKYYSMLIEPIKVQCKFCGQLFIAER